MLPVVEPPTVVIERSRSPTPVNKETESLAKEEDEEEEEEEESILSPSRKGDATGDSGIHSGTGTGGTSIPSTPDSVFLERTIDRSDIESTSGYILLEL